jgi:hypothetical protein
MELVSYSDKLRLVRKIILAQFSQYLNEFFLLIARSDIGTQMSYRTFWNIEYFVEGRI